MKKIKVACFGLQGFGNDLLLALASEKNVEIVALYTRETVYPFLYYDCEKIETLAERTGIPVFYVPVKGDWKCQLAALALVSSFHRIFKKEHLACFRFAVNLHPSLLPAYKGATPTNWMAKNQEKIVGVSAHLIDEGVDTGVILYQRQMLNPYLSDNELRRTLSFLSREIVREVIQNFPNYQGVDLSNANESSQPARGAADAIIAPEDLSNLDELISHIKAFTNFPMPKLRLPQGVFTIDYASPREAVEIKVAGQQFEVLGYWGN